MSQKSEFLEKIRSLIRYHQLSYATEKNYVGWIRRFIPKTIPSPTSGEWKRTHEREL